MKLNKNLGLILLSIWLIAHALRFLFTINVPPVILPILALITGVVILLLDESLRIRLNKNLGLILLSLWLIVHGIISLYTVSVPGLLHIVPILTLVAGVVILLCDENLHIRLNKSLGMILLGIVLICLGLTNLFRINALGLIYVFETFALITGVVILLFNKSAPDA